MDEFPQPVDDEGDERKGNQRQQRDLPVGVQENSQYQHERHDRVGGIHDAGPEGISHGADVVGRKRHKIAGRRLLKIGERQLLD